MIRQLIQSCCAGLLAIASGLAQTPPAYSVRTIAGGVAIPYRDSDVTSLRLIEPQHAAVDASGAIYISDLYYNRVLRLAPDGTVISIAGGETPGFNGDGGPSTDARLNSPEALAFGSNGDLYICDSQNRRIRKIAPDGVITTIAGNGSAAVSGDNGQAISAGIGTPWGIAIDEAGALFFSDVLNSVVRRIDTSGTITTVAGSVRGFAGDGGPAVNARLQDPRGVAVDAAGNLYIADYGNHRIRRVSGGVIRTFAGNGNTGFTGDNGAATSATLFFPSDVRVDVSNNVFIADHSNGLLRRVIASGVISTIRTTVRWTLPLGLAFDGNNGLLIVDDLRRQIARVGLSSLDASVVVRGAGENAQGDGGPAAEAGFLEPWGLALDGQGNLYVADTRDSRIRRVSPDGLITTHAGNGLPEQSGDNDLATTGAVGAPRALLAAADGKVLVTTAVQGGYIRSIDPNGILATLGGTNIFGYRGDGGPARDAAFFNLVDMAIDDRGNLYLSDALEHRIRRISAEGIVTTVAGAGIAGFSGDGELATLARLSGPGGVAIDPEGRLVIADTGNNRIRRVEVDGTIATIAGTGMAGAAGDAGPASLAQLAAPRGIRYDSDGNLLIALPARIRRISASGNIYTIAGAVGGPTAPENIALGTAVANVVSLIPAPDGSIYFVEAGARRMRKLEIISTP